MIGIETLESTTEETELLPDEVAELRSIMQSKIAEAVELRVFTDKEAGEWEAGFEACDRLEYMENLVDIVDDFVISGLEVMEELTASLDTDLLTKQEKIAWQSQAEELSFRDKCELIEDLAIILRDVAQLKRQLAQLLNTKVMSKEKAKELEQQFQVADAPSKEGVVMRAALTATEINPRSQTIAMHIRKLIVGQQFEIARQTLWMNLTNGLTNSERSHLASEIDAAEINQARQMAQAA